MDNEKVIKELLNILNSVSTYKSGNNVFLSDGNSFPLPQLTTTILNSNSKSYR
jgi:hypothetical protein